MIALLVTQKFLDDYQDLIATARARDGLDFEPVLLPLAPADPPLTEATCARVEAALLSRDVRVHKDGQRRFDAAIGRLPNLKWLHFGNAGGGAFAWLPPLYARGVQVTSSAGANAEPLAQSALFSMLYLGRRAYRWIANARERAWVQQLEPDAPADLAGQTVMVLGMGNVGSHFTRCAKALGMRVIGVRRSPRRPDDLADAIEPPARIRALLPECDWLVIACPLTQQTRGLIDRAALACMKPTAHLINVGRGEVTDEQAVEEALVTGRLAGAHLDVFSQEPLPPTSPLWSLPNVLITPHNSAVSAGNARRSAEIFVDNLVRYARGEALRNPLPE